MSNSTLGQLCEHIYSLPVFPQNVIPRFVGDLPSLSDVGCGIVLLEGVSNLEYFAEREHEFGESTLFKPLLRFVLRTKTYPRGSEWSDAIRECLHRYHDDFILSCVLRGSPMYLGRNSEKLHEFQLTFSTIIKE